MGCTRSRLIETERAADFVDPALVFGDGTERSVFEQIRPAVAHAGDRSSSPMSSAATRVVPIPSSLQSVRATSMIRRLAVSIAFNSTCEFLCTFRGKRQIPFPPPARKPFPRLGPPMPSASR